MCPALCGTREGLYRASLEEEQPREMLTSPEATLPPPMCHPLSNKVHCLKSNLNCSCCCINPCPLLSHPQDKEVSLASTCLPQPYLTPTSLRLFLQVLFAPPPDFHHFSYWLWLLSRTPKSFFYVTVQIRLQEKAKCSGMMAPSPAHAAWCRVSGSRSPMILGPLGFSPHLLLGWGGGLVFNF